MTTLATNRPMTTPAPPRPGAGHPGAATTGPTIDPIRLLKKYKWVLAGAVALGIMVGIAGFVALRILAPRYDAFAIFEVQGQRIQSTVLLANVREDELERYMLTQANLMVSDTVLSAVTSLNTIQDGSDAPKWSKQFIVKGVFDPKAARIDLQERVKARVVPGTQFIRLSASYRDKNDVYNLVKRIREAYQAYISKDNLTIINRQIDVLTARLNDVQTEITRLTNERRTRLGDPGIDSIDSRLNEARNAVAGINAQLNDVLLTLEGQRATLLRLEEDSKNPNGPRYDESLRSEVEASPLIANFKMRIHTLETELRAMEGQGYGPAHSEYRRLEADLQSQKDQLDRHRESELSRVFFARIQETRNLINQLQAQHLDLQNRHRSLEQELNRVLQIQVEISDFDTQIAEQRAIAKQLQEDIANQVSLREQFLRPGALSGKRDLYEDRVRLVLAEAVPDQLAFPKIVIILPAGVVLVCGLVTAGIVIRELVDQRVRGPADLAMLPKARILGMVPMGSLDPAGRTAVETAFRDRPTGAIAEHFRQIRAPLIKRMEQAGHRSLVIAAGMPDSGATTAAVNLAFAAAASDQRVLLIDANFRRPSIHKILGTNEFPGLADVLANGQGVPFANAVQKAGPNFDVLTAGSKNLRIYERLGTEAMAELLAEAKANYNLVLIDAPPMLVSGDALALANRADASILVVRALSERRGLVNRLRNELGEARGEFLGVIVNGVRPSAGGYLKRNVRATHEYQASAE